MGQYFNPGNVSFKRALNSQIYVDKSGMIGFINSVLNTEQSFMAVSRARRFGKSMSLGLLTAYYSKGCDSRDLFKGLKAEALPSFESELNKNDVIHVDLQAFRCFARNERRKEDGFYYMQTEVIRELRDAYPDIVKEDDISLPTVLNRINEKTGESFIVLIDEWDCIFREDKNNKELQDEYINFLRGMFKSENAKKFIKLAYLTGILPIKKYGTQSALNNFKEYTMVRPGPLAEYTGFTEAEVKALCERYNMDFEEAKNWYDGYSFVGARSVYNPNSVVDAMFNHEYGSYWTRTDTYKVLSEYIGMNIDGLRDDIISMLDGNACNIEPEFFQNDMVTINNKGDVMTLLVHLGYLAYDSMTGMVRIPNKEIAREFAYAVSEQKAWGEVATAIGNSDQFLKAIIKGDTGFICHQLSVVHEEASKLSYNNEIVLASTINLAFYTSFRFYTVFRELDSGKGFADMVYLPKPGCPYPALLIELKYNESTETALNQIKEKRYTGRLTHYLDNLLMVGINYDKETKKHSCIIETNKV